MLKEVEDSLINTFVHVEVPYSGSMQEWVRENITLPPAYSESGRCDLSTSPWLIQPLEDTLNPDIRMIIKIMGVRIGKTMTDDCVIPYWVSQDPGSILRIFQDDVTARNHTDTKLLPILRSCKCTAPLIPDKKGVRNGLINLPTSFIRYSGDKISVGNNIGIKYLILDEAHLYDAGLIKKFISRTLDYSDRCKIIISSTPDFGGSELETLYLSATIMEWQWKCQNDACGKYQPYWWSKQRDDLTFGGFNWETILTPDGEHTDIEKTAKTCCLECFYCRNRIPDGDVVKRRRLNDEGKYVVIHQGDPSIRAYTVPLFVNYKLPFAWFATEYLKAKQAERMSGGLLNQDSITFWNNYLAKFYKADLVADYSKIMRGDYIPNPTEYDKQWVNILTVDYQVKGKLKFYECRAWHKNGNESRRLAFGVCRAWEEIEELRKKWNVRIPCVGVDSGAGQTTDEVYQTCIKFGEPYKLNGHYGYDCWVPMKGDQKLSYSNHEDKVSRYYSPVTKSDPKWVGESKYKGIMAPLILWSNYSIKSILTNLRDNKIPGVKWLVDSKDAEYEKQMYSEGLMTVVDKRTGHTKQIWKKIGDANEYFDCAAMNLTLAIRAKVFSATSVNEDELIKAIPQGDLIPKT